MRCMDLKTYLKEQPRGTAARLAETLQVSPVIVSQWVADNDKARPVPFDRCVAIELATGGAVTRKDLRPDDWHLMWPELAEVGSAA